MNAYRRFVFRIPAVDGPMGGVHFLIACAAVIATRHETVLLLSNEVDGRIIPTLDPAIRVWYGEFPLRDGDVVISTDAHTPTEIARIGNADVDLCNVVAVQNHYYFTRYLPYARQASVLGIDRLIATSDAIEVYLNRYFPSLKVHRMHYAVPLLLPMEKQPMIALMSRKRRNEARLIESTFRYCYPEYRYWQFRDIDNLSHSEALAIMNQATLFISLQKFEGFGLPALEAMAAGCAVVGFTGGGGNEYAAPDNGIWADEDDWERIAGDLACLIADREAGGDWIARLGAAGRATAARYDTQRMRAGVHAFVDSLTGR